uniref:Uncharacterized protein n=1 Tax=Oryza glaberrima TaxID=4538 RepID=I1PEV5_ORYGL
EMEDELVSLSFFFPVLLLVARLVRQDREKSLRLPGYPVGWSRWLVKHITRFRKNLVHTKISCLPVVTKHSRYIHAMQGTKNHISGALSHLSAYYYTTFLESV